MPYNLKDVLQTAKSMVSSFDVLGFTEYTVVCQKHNQTIHFIVFNRVFANEFDIVNVVDDKVREALKSCPGCLHEKEYTKSRFPEGAEI